MNFILGKNDRNKVETVIVVRTTTASVVLYRFAQLMFFACGWMDGRMDA